MATPTPTAWKRAPVDPLRLVKLKVRWKSSAFDPEGYLKNGAAVDIYGRNRYTKVPVSAAGLTSSAHDFQEWVKRNFPDTPTTANYGVDRNQRGADDLSDHAKGEACDIITQKYDGVLGISKRDVDWGAGLFAAVVADMKAGLAAGRRRKNWDGQWVCGLELDTEYVLFHGEICRASEGCVVRKVNSGDPHNDHLHWSGAPRDKPAAALPVLPAPDPTKPPKETRRTLRYRGRAFRRMTGLDVVLVQRVVGAIPMDGIFGPMTSYAVKKWQKTRGITVDGVIGPQSWAEIDKVIAP